MGWMIPIIITDYRNFLGLFSVAGNNCKSKKKITIGSVINPDNGLEKTSCHSLISPDQSARFRQSEGGQEQDQ
jgi:hypothetical protein